MPSQEKTAEKRIASWSNVDSSIEVDGNMTRLYAIVHCKESLLHLGRGRLFSGGGVLHNEIFLCMCRKQNVTYKVNRNLNESY